MNTSRIVRNMIRVGQVNSVHPSKGSIDVLFDDRDDLVVSDLPLLNFEYHIPDVGDQVLCVFLGNGLEQGFCLGGFYSDVFLPPARDENIYKKQIDENMYLEYNKKTKLLKVNVDEVKFEIHNGKVTVKAEEILLGGDATEGVPLGNELKQWLDNHTHPYTWSDSGGNDTSGKPTSPSPVPSEKVKTL